MSSRFNLTSLNTCEKIDSLYCLPALTPVRFQAHQKQQHRLTDMSKYKLKGEYADRDLNIHTY